MSDLFKDLKVIELANVLAGPSAGMFFAELGAQVIKIENPATEGDLTRKWKLPTEKKGDISAYFCSINYGKKHLFLDYNKPDDLEEVKTLIHSSDIVISNFKKGSSEKFGLDYKSLRKTNPSLIYAQLNGFKVDVKRPAFDVVIQAETGYMHMNGQKDGPPTKMPLAFIDILAGHQLKEGILVALLNREKTKKGCYLETSLEESGIASLANQASNYLMADHIPTRLGSLHPNIAPYGEVFTTKDGEEVVVAVGSEKQFQSFCCLLGLDDIPKNDLFSTNSKRVANRSALNNILNEAINTWNIEDLIDNCTTNVVPVGKIKDLAGVFETQVAKAMILEEAIDGKKTRRVKSVAFNIH